MESLSVLDNIPDIRDKEVNRSRLRTTENYQERTLVILPSTFSLLLQPTAFPQPISEPVIFLPAGMLLAVCDCHRS